MNSALILNFTGNHYHFGCYGTAHEIYYRLLERGYFVNYISVQVTHGLECYPETGDQFLDAGFFKRFRQANVSLVAALNEADIVVVNGEGTLHRLSKGAMSLLYMIYLARSMQKRVYLINHSCFPMGDTSRGEFDLIYRAALSGLEDIVVREPLSALFYEAHSITSRQGFDSLPLFIGRHDMLNLRTDGVDEGKIVLCGGIAYDQKLVAAISRILAGLGSGHNFEFLVGGKANLAMEDPDVFKQFERTGLNLKLKEAETFEQWCRTIASAELVVSGRFHYTVAAMSMAVPCISFPSNTPKVEGIYRMFSLDGYLEWGDENFTDKFTMLLERAKSGELILTDKQRLEMIEKAENNYTRLA